MSVRSIHPGRRSRRVSLAFHVEVSGISLNGIPYSVQAAASDVSDRVCRVHLTREVKPGDHLSVRIICRASEPHRVDPFLYRAAWVEPIENCSAWIAGLSALDPGHYWCINSHQEPPARD